ncbi:MAG: HAMP domain-containing histidine kinase [Oscillospiraceae bacterium]|nr:HAMP domain-containing histidine kinase [Oscillospiraceae bacterium]
MSSLIVLGAVFLLFARSYFEADRYEALARSANRAAAVTSSNYEMNRRRFLDEQTITLMYSIISSTAGPQLFLVQLDGTFLYRDPTSAIESADVTIPQEVVDAAAAGGYSATGLLPGVYTRPHYIVGIPAMDSDSTAFAVILAASPANDMYVFLGELSKMLLWSAALVLIVASVVILFLTSGMVRPLELMLDATQSFTKGDFSKRVPVSGYDEIGRLSMAFNKMASALALNESTRRSFIANVSHELKTPMTTIGGFVDGILDGTVPEEKRDQYLQVVSSEVGRLSRLVRSMLDTTRIEAGEMELRPVVFDISETVRQAVFTFEQNIEDKMLEIRGLEADHIMVLADQDLMHQVVYNLVENAVKFAGGGGCIEISYRTQESFTYAAIRNSGAGISKEEFPHIFERFYKSDRSRSRDKSGVGLGLHIARSIVNYHDGDITVRSVEGEYAEFEFYIPSAPKA